MAEEELSLINQVKQGSNKGPVGKFSALDRAENLENLQLDIANQTDDTVFIDHLPNTRAGLRQLYEAANKHIRELETSFFLEEDSDEERELKQNCAKQSVSAANFNV